MRSPGRGPPLWPPALPAPRPTLARAGRSWPVNVGEFAGKEFLLNLDRTERAEFYKLLDEAPWEGKTASGHWQVRDLCGHMIDVTESYLERFGMERAGQEAPPPLGLPIMASKLDEGAQRFRSLSKEQAITRLKTASDKMFE